MVPASTTRLWGLGTWSSLKSCQPADPKSFPILTPALEIFLQSIHPTIWKKNPRSIDTYLSLNQLISDGCPPFRHRRFLHGHFGTCKFQPCGRTCTWKFRFHGRFDTRTFRHREILVQWIFGTMNVSARDISATEHFGTWMFWHLGKQNGHFSTCATVLKCPCNETSAGPKHARAEMSQWWNARAEMSGSEMVGRRLQREGYKMSYFLAYWYDQWKLLLIFCEYTYLAPSRQIFLWFFCF